MRINPYVSTPQPTAKSTKMNNNPFDKIAGAVKDKNIMSPEENLETLKSVYGEKELKKIGVIECTTCANRTYVDGSNDPGVSFKTPGKISPEASAGTVMSHELEHVANERADAQSEGREIVSQSVTLSSAICPECGVSYVSGGETKTVSKSKTDYSIPDELLKGSKVDKKI